MNADTGILYRDLAAEVERRLGLKADEDTLRRLASALEGRSLTEAFENGEAARILTVNETYFFRESAHFRFLQHVLVPRFSKTGGILRICSAAQATGCEPYSIAMILELSGVSYHIDAFDLNPDVVGKAKRGIYGKNTLRDDGSEYHFLLDRWSKKNGDEFEINNSLKRHINFFTHNLMDGVGGELCEDLYDIVFFRNAFIYFSPGGRARALDAITRSLRGGGVLITGVSETAAVHHKNLADAESDEVFYFEKRDGADNAAALSFPDISVVGAAALPQQTPLPQTAPAYAAPAYAAPPPGSASYAIDPHALQKILADDDSVAALSRRVLSAVKGGSSSFTGSELAAAVLSLLGHGDFSAAAPLLDYLRKQGLPGAEPDFLRGEYYYFQDMFTEAEIHYKVSLGKNDAFWPSFYRLVSVSPAGVLKTERAAMAMESLRRGRDRRYEVYIGGFSPDYYLGALEKCNTAVAQRAAG